MSNSGGGTKPETKNTAAASPDDAARREQMAKVWDEVERKSASRARRATPRRRASNTPRPTLDRASEEQMQRVWARIEAQPTSGRRHVATATSAHSGTHVATTHSVSSGGSAAAPATHQAAKPVFSASRQAEAEVESNEPIVDQPTVTASVKKEKPAKVHKKLTKLQVGAIIAVVVVVIAAICGFALYKQHEAYLASPTGQANSIYQDYTSGMNKEKFAEKWGDKYDEYIDEVAGVNYKKMTHDDMAKVQYCMIYSGKTEAVTSLTWSLYSKLYNAESEGKDVYPKDLPLDSSKAKRVIGL